MMRSWSERRSLWSLTGQAVTHRVSILADLQVDGDSQDDAAAHLHRNRHTLSLLLPSTVSPSTVSP